MTEPDAAQCNNCEDIDPATCFVCRGTESAGQPLDLDSIEQRAHSRQETFGTMIGYVVDLIAEIRQLRTELAGMTDLKDRALTKQDTIRAELEQYTALDLGAPDGRVSATCDNSEHPTWLRKPDDTRGCPWCELDQTRKQSESCDHESWEAGPRRLIGRKAVQSRRCADCGDQLPPYPIQIS